LILIFNGRTHEMRSIGWLNVPCGDDEENIGCWFRKSCAGKRKRRSYSLADTPEDISRERWNQSGFDVKPLTPTFSEKRWNLQEMGAVLSRVRRLHARSCGLK
jgi:hypothetical protein